MVYASKHDTESFENVLGLASVILMFLNLM